LYDKTCPLPHFRLPRKMLVDKDDYDNWLKRYRIAKAGKNLDAIVNELVGEL
jgi:hypothetical protein